MATYRVQAAYKDTDGDLMLTAKVFEAENKAEASTKAEAYFTTQYSFCDRDEFLFSTPKKVDSIRDVSRGVSIGGSASGATIITGNGSTVVQHGKTNINLGSLNGVRIGDDY